MKGDDRIPRQYGLWDSPVTPASIAHGLRLSDVSWDDETGALIWLEWRSDQGVLVELPPDGEAIRDLTSDLSVRARVGYGGGDFTAGNGHVYFVEAESARIFKKPIGFGTAPPITPAFGASASPTLSPNGEWLLFVRSYERKDSIDIVDADGKKLPQKLVSGEDFYMQPRWHPDSKKIAWIAWNHPQMPWDGTWLRIGTLKFPDGGLPVIGSVETVAGDEHTSIFQPEFSPDGRYLAYVSDESGWWQIYLYDLSTGEVRQVTHREAEHGMPAWIQGMRTYAFSADSGSIYYTENVAGFVELWRYDLATGESRRIDLEGYTSLGQPAVSPKTGALALLSSGASIPPRVIVYEEGRGVRVVRRSTTESLPPEDISEPEAITWKGMDGGLVHGLYFAPRNSRFEGKGKPPLIVHVHGGPTSQATAAFNTTAQFFTSRGYAFLEVNYRGSTGYGREYRDALKGNWGIYDVQDSVAGAKHLVSEGLVDGERLVIMGGSAGGFTVLKALEDYPGFFKAGICLFGVSNHFTLAAETHKFEERYLDSLLGPLPEASKIYRERSPIFFANRIKDPIAIFQGEIDQVVPKDQSDTIVESLRRRGVPHEYHVYPGEGHGWRKKETIEKFFTSVERFLRQYVIFS